MKKQHFFIVLLFALAAIIISNRPPYATTWAATNSNEMVTRAALLDAVNNGVFTANTTIPNDDECVTREQAQAYVNINAITGYDMNELVPKSAFVAATVYYGQTFYGKCVGGDGAAPLAGYPSAAAALSAGSTGQIATLNLIVNRPPELGDSIINPWMNSYGPVINTDDGICGGEYGYWIYSPAINAAIRLSAIAGPNKQAVVEIVYPSGSTNVSICLLVDISGSSATVQAVASTAVSTNVTVNWGYSVNGTEGIASPFTINNGATASSTQTITHGSTISSFTVFIDGFSPSSNGTQNYISGGTCN